MKLEDIMKDGLGELARFFLENPVLSFSIADLEKNTSLSPGEIKERLRVLKRINVIKPAGKPGEFLFKLNGDSDMSNLLTVVDLKLRGELKGTPRILLDKEDDKE